MLDFNDKPQIWRLPDVSLHKLAVVLRLLNERAFCTRLPNTPTTLLFLSATLNLNSNLLPFCLLQCDLSVRSGPIIQSGFQAAGSFNSVCGVDLVRKSGVSSPKWIGPGRGRGPSPVHLSQ